MDEELQSFLDRKSKITYSEVMAAYAMWCENSFVGPKEEQTTPLRRNPPRNKNKTIETEETVRKTSKNTKTSKTKHKSKHSKEDSDISEDSIKEKVEKKENKSHKKQPRPKLNVMRLTETRGDSVVTKTVVTPIISPSNRPKVGKGTQRSHLKWGEEETEALINGIKEFGAGDWLDIMNKYQDIFNSTGRNKTDLCRRWQTLREQGKYKELWDRKYVRPKKSK